MYLARSLKKIRYFGRAAHQAGRRGRVPRSLLPLVCLCLLLGDIAVAGAGEPSAADRAAAQDLFDNARELMNDDRYEEACDKFEESQRLDPAPGTQLNLADCFERIGKTASAWINFLEVAAKAKKEYRIKVAKERAEALEPELVRLTILVPHKVSGLEIKRDDNLVREPLWETALPIDPGKHTITATAPGKKPWTQKFDIDEDKKQHEITVAKLEDAPIEPKPKPDKPEPVTPPSDGSINRILALVGGGVGVIGIGLGTAFGVIAMGKNDESLEHCLASDSNLCEPEGVTLRDEALTAANVSTAGFVIGGVGLAAGLVLWFTAPSAPEGDEADKPLDSAAVRFVPAIAGDGGTMILQGTW